MSSFQTALAIAGAVVLIAVVAYNAWTNRRSTPKRARPAPPVHPDSGRHDPSLDGSMGGVMDGQMPHLSDEVVHSGAEDADPDRTPTQEAVRIDPVVHLSDLHAPHWPGQIDALIDAIVPIALDHQVSGDAALAAMPATRRVGSKPLTIEGFNEATQQWEKPQSGQRYQQFQAGVQLANRLGALNDIEFSEFVAKIQAFADAINGAPEFPDMRHEVARARELDQFSSAHDAQLSFLLRARQAAWSPGYVQQSAAALGFVPGPMPGRMVLPAPEPGLPPLLTLAYDAQAAMSDEPEHSALREVELSVDVPQVARSAQPFVRLREVAGQLGATMDGVLCDQNGQPLPAMAMDPIAADLEQLYDQLDERELSAGSVLARRVFS